MMLRSTAVVAAAVLAGCAGKEAEHTDTASAPGTVASATDTSAMLRGTIASVSSTNLVLNADTGSVTIKLVPHVEVFDREAATLADVKDNTFIGVTTVKQPDGSEQATEIHIFPEVLRGLGEGSRMMAQSGNNRMTNGSATAASASPASRMSNGNVSGASGSTFVVQYAGGSQKVVVPSNTPVTKIAATSKRLAQGEKVVVLAKRNADGSLSASRVMMSR